MGLELQWLKDKEQRDMLKRGYLNEGDTGTKIIRLRTQLTN